MAIAAQQVSLSPDSEKGVLTYAEKCHQLLMNQYSIRSNLETIDRYYTRENDWSEEQIKAKITNRAGDKDRIQNVTVPIVMPHVEAAAGYMANVFLTGYPIFGVSADPSQEDAALQMETIIAENALTAGWHRQLMMFFRDGLKYNLHGLELEWQQKNVYTVDTDVSMPNSAKPKTTLWKGNVLKRLDLYNTFFDPRVHPSEIHSEGEYAGYIEMFSRVRMKKMMNDLFGKVSISTVKRALESTPAPGGMTSSGAPFSYYMPLINPYPIMTRSSINTFDWMAWANPDQMKQNSGNIRYGNVYEVMKLYARIIPADFGMKVSEENTPQVWKFIIVNGKVVVVAERQSNVHNFLPMFFGQPLEDGLDYQTKSFAQNVMDMQDIASSMWNGYIASKRRLVGDRVIYDPLRIREKDINSANPAAKIPVRPSAYGKPVSEAVFQFPYHDEATQTLLNGAQIVIGYADKINGQNAAQQGQFQKGNKTKFEYEDIMGHGNTHNQIMAMATEVQVFTPMKEAIKLNILQYQNEVVLYNRDKNSQVNVKPSGLRAAAVHFKVSDGLLPTEEQMSTDEFQTAIQTIGSSSTIGSGYNMTPLFTYIMKLRGCDLRPFEKSPLQIQFEQQQQQWQQVAEAAIKAGQKPPPQPQMPPQLVQELQQIQQQGGTMPSPTSAALESTQGDQ
jgi:hypothetical protein